MSFPYPTYVGQGTTGTSSPVVPQFLQGAYVAAASAMLAVYGGVTLTKDTRIWRAYITGPPGSTCRVFVTDQQPAAAVPDMRYLVASTPAGIEDEANWEGGLLLPSGWFLVFAWAGGLVSVGLAPDVPTARLETQAVG